jgi:hypothetical protein
VRPCHTVDTMTFEAARDLSCSLHTCTGYEVSSRTQIFGGFNTICTMVRKRATPHSIISGRFDNLASDICAGTPVIRLAIRFSQPEEAFPERECRTSINKTYKVLVSKLGTTGYLTLGQGSSTSRDTARKSSSTKIRLSCYTFPLFRRLGDNANIFW